MNYQESEPPPYFSDIEEDLEAEPRDGLGLDGPSLDDVEGLENLSISDAQPGDSK